MRYIVSRSHIDVNMRYIVSRSHIDVNMRYIVHRSLLNDYIKAKASFPDETIISDVLDALLLSRKALQRDPAQLVPQLFGRLPDTQVSHLYNIMTAGNTDLCLK